MSSDADFVREEHCTGEVRVMIECPTCAVPQPAGAKFCSSCGAVLAAVCAACGSALPAGARFCAECGTPAGGTPAPNAVLPHVLPTPVASRRITSVLFGDLVGFT